MYGPFIGAQLEFTPEDWLVETAYYYHNIRLHEVDSELLTLQGFFGGVLAADFAINIHDMIEKFVIVLDIASKEESDTPLLIISRQSYSVDIFTSQQRNVVIHVFLQIQQTLHLEQSLLIFSSTSYDLTGILSTSRSTL